MYNEWAQVGYTLPLAVLSLGPQSQQHCTSHWSASDQKLMDSGPHTQSQCNSHRVYHSEPEVRDLGTCSTSVAPAQNTEDNNTDVHTYRHCIYNTWGSRYIFGMNVTQWWSQTISWFARAGVETLATLGWGWRVTYTLGDMNRSNCRWRALCITTLASKASCGGGVSCSKVERIEGCWGLAGADGGCSTEEWDELSLLSSSECLFWNNICTHKSIVIGFNQMKHMNSQIYCPQ